MRSAGRAEPVVRTGLVLIGLITTGPVLALVDPGTLEWGYGIGDVEGMTLALLQHRGMLQLLLGAALVWAAFFRPARLAAALAAITGKTTFLALILPDPVLRTDLALFSAVFDLTCVVLLAGLAVHEIRTLRTPS
jgi:hypothetical protein